ncbi:carboxypeptidase regulatory-like domain-containing protein [Streptomyces sp. NPDC091290]|uniref:carboxypeptidase regulatory-like domain-containing protein n=1 Tax=Streptomyces sp. NPDC091290 TaxID=3365990 RepID=UPI0037FBCA9E
MSRTRKTTILAALAAAGALFAAGPPGTARAAGGSPDPVGHELWASATIEPGRAGIVQAGGYEGAPLGAGSVLTLTAPAGTRVTGMPFAASGFRGSVAAGGHSASYAFQGTAAAGAWHGRTFPFVLTVSPDAEPGTRLPDCTLDLRDAKGTVHQRGGCAVTVGLPAPTLSRPDSGVALGGSPETSGTAYPGAQVTVVDALEQEVCSATAAPDGTWSCVPGVALAAGPGRLQATATLNGVSATSEQIDITVAG